MRKIFTLLLFIFATHLNAATVSSDKHNYLETDTVTIQFKEMTGLNKDWIGIYPKGKNSDWDNVVQWRWTGDKASGKVVFNNLPKGNYRVRVFYNNSYHAEANSLFRIGEKDTTQPTLIETRKDIYAENEKVQVRVDNMLGDPKDWVGIYPKDSSNAWGNVVQWSWTDGKQNNLLAFKPLKVGEYEVRAFFRNSFKTEASYAFKVIKTTQTDTKVTTNKTIYTQNEKVTVKFSKMKAHQDWIGIYPKESSNDWDNVVQWAWTEDLTNGSHTFTNLPAGEYEARVFFDNSFQTEASYAFKIIKNTDTNTKVTIKSNYGSNENVTVHFTGMKAHKDWIGIYPVGKSNAWSNVIQWAWTDDIKKGSHIFKNLPIGYYEARVFFDNSFHDEAKERFTIVTTDLNTIYERASKCLSDEGNKDKQVLCFNEQDEDIVYVIENTEEEDYIYTVNLAKGLHGIELTQSVGKYGGQPDAYFIPLKDTNLIAIYQYEDVGDPEDIILFYYQSEEPKLVLLFGDVNGKYNGKYKTIDNGQKLEVTYKKADDIRSVGKKFKEIYDISNPNKIQLISKTQI